MQNIREPGLVAEKDSLVSRVLNAYLARKRNDLRRRQVKSFKLLILQEISKDQDVMISASILIGCDC